MSRFGGVFFRFGTATVVLLFYCFVRLAYFFARLARLERIIGLVRLRAREAFRT
jgi:hypothetical protein